MRRICLAAVLMAGCSSPSGESTLPTGEDRAQLLERLEAALQAPYVSGRFYAEYEVDGRVLMKCRGISRGFRSGVVMIEEESESGGPLLLLRVGDRAWIYKDGWQDSAGTGWAGLGRGFQNPYDVLAILESAAEKFLPHRQGGIFCPALKGHAILEPLSDRAGAHPPERAPIDGVLKKGFREGPLVTRFSAEEGSAVWIAKMDIVNWGPAPPMRFDDIPAPFTPDMKAAVRKALQEDGK